jgi:DNA-binding LacI/PurR family transcriptional regulator
LIPANNNWTIITRKPLMPFCGKRAFAVTSIKTANKIGLNVPKDLAVIAFTDGIISKYSTPTITTVSQSGIKMGIEPQNADRQIGIGRGA